MLTFAVFFLMLGALETVELSHMDVHQSLQHLQASSSLPSFPPNLWRISSSALHGSDSLVPHIGPLLKPLPLMFRHRAQVANCSAVFFIILVTFLILRRSKRHAHAKDIVMCSFVAANWRQGRSTTVLHAGRNFLDLAGAGENLQPSPKKTTRPFTLRPRVKSRTIRVSPEDVAPDFPALGVSDELTAALADMRLVRPTAIQSGSFRPIYTGANVIMAAETGTGKTLAYLVPLIQWLLDCPARVLVIQLNRELCVQTTAVCQSLLYSIPSERGSSIYVENCFEKQPPPGDAKSHVLISTLSFAVNRFAVKEDPGFSVVVIDEADFLISEDKRRIQRLVGSMMKRNPKCQWIVVAATVPGFVGEDAINVRRKIRRTWPDAIWVRTVGLHRAPDSLTQVFEGIRMEDRAVRLVKTLRGITAKDKGSRVLIFAATKDMTEEVAKNLKAEKFRCEVFHAGVETQQRLQHMADFNSGQLPILVATSAASRGIDFQGVTHVINYTLPWNAMEYLHSVGRTARNNAPGVAITFHLPEEDVPVAEMRTLVEEHSSMERAFQQTSDFGIARDEAAETRQRMRAKEREVRKRVKLMRQVGKRKVKQMMNQKRRETYREQLQRREERKEARKRAEDDFTTEYWV